MSNFFLKSIVHLLIFQFIVGTSVIQAAAVPKNIKDVTATHTVQYTPDQQALLAAVTNPQRELPKLKLQNAFNMYGQKLVSKDGKERYSLEDTVGNPEIILPNGILQRKLTILKSNDGISKHSITLTLNSETNRSWFAKLWPLKPYQKYDHVISLPEGVELISSVYDNELCYFLLSDGTIKAVHMEALHLLYGNAPIPLYEVAKIAPEQGRDIHDYSLKLIKRRYIPADKSREGMLARIDKNEKTRLELLTQVHTEQEVANLENNLETLRPIPLTDGLRSRLRDNLGTQDPTLYAGDLAIVRQNGRQEIVDIVNRFAGLFLMGLQHFTLQGMWVAASPNNIGNTKNTWALNDLGQNALAQIASDPELKEIFYESGLQEALAQVPKEALGAVTQNILAVFQRIAKVLKQGTPNALRDSFTHEMQLNDFAEFQKLLQEVKTNAPYNTKVAKLSFWLAQKWQSKFGIPALMQKVAGLLKWPLMGVGAVATGLGLESMVGYQEQASAQLNYIFSIGKSVVDQYLPILTNPQYMWDAIRTSVPMQAGMIASIFIVGYALKPFFQHPVNKLLTIAGIKYLFSIPMIPPQRVLLGWLNRGATLKSLQKGVIPWGLLIPRLDAHRAIPSQADKIAEIESQRSAEFLTALNRVAEDRGMSVFQLVQIIASNPNSDEAKDVESETGGNIIRQFKERYVRGFIQGFANFQEKTYRQMKYPMPDDFTSNYVMNSTWVDGLFTIGLMFMVGEFANPNEPEKLMYQPDAFLWTHRINVISNLENIALHLGVSGAQVYETMSKKVLDLLSNYKPAGAVDTDRNQSTRSAYRDLFALGNQTLDLRNNNWATAAAERGKSMCIRLAQGVFIVGMLLRLLNASLEGKPADEIFSTHNLMAATVGQLYFMYLAPYVYRWIWGVHVQINKGLDQNIKKIGEGFNDLYLELTSALEKRDEVTVEAKLQQILTLYNQKHMTFSDDMLKDIKRKKDETIAAWGNRMLEIIQKQAPVPEKINDSVQTGYMLFGSIATTILATVLLNNSFKGREFMGDGTGPTPGIDLNHWKLWEGASSADSIPGLMAKSIAGIMAVQAAGLTYDAVWDTAMAAKAKVKYGLSSLMTREFGEQNPDFKKAINAGQKASGSWDVLSRFLGIKWMLGIRPSVKAGETKALATQCADAILQAR